MRRLPMKKFAFFAVVVGVASLAVLPACRTTTPDELKNSIELLDLETKWVSKYYQPWPRVRKTLEGTKELFTS